MIRNASPVERVHQYCESVLSGETVACKALIQAVERFNRDLADNQSPYVFEESIANAYCEMIPAVFCHFEGDLEGHPIVLEPWQMFLVANIFAWKRKIDGKRRFRKGFVTMGRKGGKSIIAAVFEIIFARLDGEGGAQVYSTATKMEQAKIVHRMVELMVKASPELLKNATVHKNNIMFPRNSFCRPLGSDRPFDGTNTHACVLDEIHAWKEHNRPFFETMVSASGTRSQPFLFMITTAGTEKSQIFNEELEYSRGILNQSIKDEQTFVMIFELETDHDFMDVDFDIELMRQANPNMGVSVPAEFYAEKLNESRHKPSAKWIFQTKYANQCGKSVGGIMDADTWDSCAGELSDWDGIAVSAGVDVGGQNDFASFGLCARFETGEDENGLPIYRYEVKSRSFISENTTLDLKAEPYRQWIVEDRLKVCEYVEKEFKQALVDDCYTYGVEFVAFDPKCANNIAETLDEIGLKPVKMPQITSHFNETIEDYLREMSEGRFRPCETDALLRMAAINMTVKRNPDGTQMPDKRNSKEKIDPIVAVLMARRAVNLALPPISGSLVL